MIQAPPPTPPPPSAPPLLGLPFLLPSPFPLPPSPFSLLPFGVGPPLGGPSPPPPPPGPSCPPPPAPFLWALVLFSPLASRPPSFPPPPRPSLFFCGGPFRSLAVSSPPCALPPLVCPRLSPFSLVPPGDFPSGGTHCCPPPLSCFFGPPVGPAFGPSTGPSLPPRGGPLGPLCFSRPLRLSGPGVSLWGPSPPPSSPAPPLFPLFSGPSGLLGLSPFGLPLSCAVSFCSPFPRLPPSSPLCCPLLCAVPC